MSKKAFITGVSTGIGAAIAEDLCRQGYIVFGSVRKMEDAASLQSKFPSLFKPLVFDVRDVSRVLELPELICGANGVLDVLVNNAGIAVSGPMELLTNDEIETQLDINVKAVIRISNALIPALIKSPNAVIINMSSVAGRFTSPMLGAYSMSKFALEAVTDAYRRELYLWGVKVYSVQPGPIKTPIWQKAASDMKDYSQTRYAKFVPVANGLLKRSVKKADPVEMVVDKVSYLINKRPKKTAHLVTSKALFYKVFLKIIPAWLIDRLMLSQIKKNLQ